MDYSEYTARLEESLILLDKAADVIIEEASKLRTEYWEKATSGPEFAHYSFNIVKQGTTYRIRWAQMTPLRAAGGAVARIVPKYLTMNKGESYPESKFKYASQKELTLIRLYEQQLSLLRTNLKRNRKIRQSLSREIYEQKKYL